MNYLFVVAHPDDEIFGAGAFIHKVLQQGHRVCVVILNSDFEKSRLGMSKQLLQSHAIVGITERVLLSYKNLNFFREDQRAIVEDIEKVIVAFEPDFVFTHWEHDLHTDHRVTCLCTQQACRMPQRYHFKEFRIKGLYYMEIPSSTDWSDTPFMADTFVEVSSEDMKIKMQSLNVYDNVMRAEPHPRREDNLYALATMRGSQAGFRYAEAFKLCWRNEL